MFKPVKEAENSDSGWASDASPCKGEYSGYQSTRNEYIHWTNFVGDKIG